MPQTPKLHSQSHEVVLRDRLSFAGAAPEQQFLVTLDITRSGNMLPTELQLLIWYLHSGWPALVKNKGAFRQKWGTKGHWGPLFWCKGATRSVLVRWRDSTHLVVVVVHPSLPIKPHTIPSPLLDRWIDHFYERDGRLEEFNYISIILLLLDKCHHKTDQTQTHH